MTEIPIACTLNRDEQQDRLRLIEDLLSDALLGQDEIAGGVRARFRDTPEIEARVRELVAAESSCCAFLSFELTRRDGQLWLEITGTPEAQPVIAEFFARPVGPEAAA
jgi:hypothetical protein